MKHSIRKLFAYLFPARCVGCRAEGSYLCTPCRQKIPRAEQPAKDWIVSVWSYKDPRIKKLLWMLKFNGTFSVIESLATELHDHIADELAERAVFENMDHVLLIPIPLSAKSMRTRGYNQARIIAEHLIRKNSGHLILLDALQKTKETPTQHSIKNRSARLQNLRGTYTVKKGADVRGRNIVLIDDITTTHATLIEARRVLKDAGAKTVLGFTVAH